MHYPAPLRKLKLVGEAAQRTERFPRRHNVCLTCAAEFLVRLANVRHRNSSSAYPALGADFTDLTEFTDSLACHHGHVTSVGLLSGSRPPAEQHRAAPRTTPLSSELRAKEDCLRCRGRIRAHTTLHRVPHSALNCIPPHQELRDF